MYYRDITMAYGVVALGLFAFLILFGKAFKKISLGNGVSVGIQNAMPLALFWPITIGCCLAGLVCECIKIWKRL